MMACWHPNKTTNAKNTFHFIFHGIHYHDYQGVKLAYFQCPNLRKDIDVWPFSTWLYLLNE